MSERACEQIQRQLLDYLRGALASDAARALESHLSDCAECATALAEERAVNELLRTRLPATKAPERLQRAVAAQLARALAESASPQAGLGAAESSPTTPDAALTAQPSVAASPSAQLTAADFHSDADARSTTAQPSVAAWPSAQLTAAGSHSSDADARSTTAQLTAAGSHSSDADARSTTAQFTAAGSRSSDADARSTTAQLTAAGSLLPAAGSDVAHAANAGPMRAPASQRAARITRRGWLIASLGTAAASLAAAGVLGLVTSGSGPAGSLQREALNDHLRVLYAQNPVEIPNGGLHQVKPWFTGRVDFAPDISFVGDDEFPMVGGAVGYFVDRKAASFVFKRRLHTISLFVFRNDGLDWPNADTQKIAGKPVQVSTLDGFHLVYWEAEGLGHVLVSDVSSAELLHLTDKLLE